MEEVSFKFVYFTLHEDGSITFNAKGQNTEELVLPRHPESNDLDIYYLQSMLKYFDPSKDVSENEILDAFPIISVTNDKNNRFYKLSVNRLRDFYKDRIEEDEYIRASMKHLFMYSLLANSTNKVLKRIIDGCLSRVSPVMYRQDERDTVDCERFQLHYLASYVPTKKFRIMKLLKGWIDGALHFYDYSIMFFDYRFVSYDNFNENVIDIRSTDLFFLSKLYDPLAYEVDPMYKGFDKFKIHESGLYFEMKLCVGEIFQKWLFTPPNNDNERDGKVMMFRNKDLQTQLQEILTCVFRKDDFRLNDVFKWNRYPNGGKFNSHYDTMFVQNSSEECSLYTLLMYMKVKGPTHMFLSGKKEVKLRLESNMAYIIPHWVKHRVEGKHAREFIKAEIVFKNKLIGTTFDQTLADAFDASCYYMLQSVRHPELKDIVSENFNTINEARFYKNVYLSKLVNKVFFIKTMNNIPFEQKVNGKLVKAFVISVNFITDGTYYYFKTKDSVAGNEPVVSRIEAIIMLSIMQMDIQPKKLFQRDVRECECPHPDPCIDYYNKIVDLEITENIVYWETTGRELEDRIADTLQCIQHPYDHGKVYEIGSVIIPDIPNNSESFYFAACQNVHPCHEYTEMIVTEITSLKGDGPYCDLNVDLIGQKRNIIKIRQHSFKNGTFVKRKWVKYADDD